MKEDLCLMLFVELSIGAMNSAIVVSNVTDGKSWEDTAQEVIKFWRDQEWPTFADSLDTNPAYRTWWDIVHITSKVFKQSTSEMIEFYSNVNRPFKKWYDDVIPNWLFVDPNFWKDYFLNGWYIPATAEACQKVLFCQTISYLRNPKCCFRNSPLVELWQIL